MTDFIDYPQLPEASKALVDALWAEEERDIPVRLEKLEITQIEAALKRGAQTDLRFDEEFVRGGGDFSMAVTPLAWALLYDRHDVFEMLLDYGASIFGTSDLNNGAPHGIKDLATMLSKIGPFYGADRKYLDAILARVNVGSADAERVASLVVSIQQDAANLKTNVPNRQVVQNRIISTFEELREMGVTFGGSKKVAVTSEATPVPQVAGTTLDAAAVDRLLPQNKGASKGAA
jgi:hypothetical protein